VGPIDTDRAVRKVLERADRSLREPIEEVIAGALKIEDVHGPVPPKLRTNTIATYVRLLHRGRTICYLNVSSSGGRVDLQLTEEQAKDLRGEVSFRRPTPSRWDCRVHIRGQNDVEPAIQAIARAVEIDVRQ
jgi:hypothetical protein